MKKIKIGSIISTIILFIILVIVYNIYLGIDFNGFVRYEIKSDTAKFFRDKNVKYSDYRSYCIEIDNEYSTAAFAKTVSVKTNTPYKVTAMIKTENVVCESNDGVSGASIGIIDTVETSKPIQGTNDWTKVEFMFNSKNRESVNIAFRLGEYFENCKGKVWFSDFKLEQGAISENTDWEVGCFIFENTDIKNDRLGNPINFKVTMDESDISTLSSSIQRFGKSFREISGNRININCTTTRIKTPITNLSYDEENGHYISYADVQNILEPYMQEKTYDHIYVIIRLGDKTSDNEVPGIDWIGLRRNGLLWNRFF